MKPEREEAEMVREFRVEGMGLLVAGGVFLAVLVGAFYLGRWVERQAAPGLEADSAIGTASAGAAVEPDAEAADQLTFFDTLSGGEKAPEPGRELPARPASSEFQTAAGAPEKATPSPGEFYAQVFAGRSRDSAAALVRELTDKGYPVHLVREKEGTGALYKVRVGGYLTRDEARAVADRLKKEGHAGAFVGPVD